MTKKKCQSSMGDHGIGRDHAPFSLFEGTV